MYTLHMYKRTRYADLSGELNEILKEIWKITSWRVLLIFCRLLHVRISSHTLIIQYFNYSVWEINSLCEKYKKKKEYIWL